MMLRVAQVRLLPMGKNRKARPALLLPEYRHVAAVVVAGDEVELAVAVEVRARERAGTSPADRHGYRIGERASPVTEQHQHMVAVGAEHQVGAPIAVEIAEHGAPHGLPERHWGTRR